MLPVMGMGQTSRQRTLPLLTGLAGRTEDILLLPGGAFVHPFMVWKIFKSRPEVLWYQVIQHELLRFEIRMAMTHRETYDRLLPDILCDFQDLPGSGAVLEPSFHERLEPASPGKFRPVASACHGRGS